jgi:7-cyano-7-deazaguanine synthase in queuosine biosynthesis
LELLKTPDTGFVPGYQLFNHLVALSVADRFNTTFVYTGEIHNAVFVSNNTDQDNDHHMYLDLLGTEDDKFYEAHYSTRDKMAEAYSYAYSGHTWGYRFVDPLLGMTKDQLITLGHRINAPMELTVTCRAPDMDKWASHDTFHCGRSDCYFCCHRRLGYARAKIADPVNYLLDEPLPKDIQSMIETSDG